MNTQRPLTEPERVKIIQEATVLMNRYLSENRNVISQDEEKRVDHIAASLSCLYAEAIHTENHR